MTSTLRARQSPSDFPIFSSHESNSQVEISRHASQLDNNLVHFFRSCKHDPYEWAKRVRHIQRIVERYKPVVMNGSHEYPQIDDVIKPSDSDTGLVHTEPATLEKTPDEPASTYEAPSNVPSPREEKRSTSPQPFTHNDERESSPAFKTQTIEEVDLPSRARLWHNTDSEEDSGITGPNKRRKISGPDTGERGTPEEITTAVMQRASASTPMYCRAIINEGFAVSTVKQVIDALSGSPDRSYTTHGEIENLTRLLLFFGKTFGPPGEKQFLQFLELCKSGVDTMEGVRPTRSEDSSIPETARRVVHAYHDQASVHASEKIYRYLRYTRLATFYREYAQMIEQVQDPDGTLRRELREQGFNTGHGRAIPSVVNDYLLWQLDDKNLRHPAKSEVAIKARRRLTTDISHGHLYSALEEIFTAGIFILLPPSKDNT